MQNLKKWLIAAFVVAAMCGTAMMIEMASSRMVAAQERAYGDHWRNHDGHWSFWHDGDRRWYYTDGRHWFYNQGNAWHLYRFDGSFGRTGFRQGDYKIPGPDVHIVPHRY